MAWAIAWTCLYGSGFFSLVASHWPLARPVVAILGTVFAALLVRGATLYAQTGHEHGRLLAIVAAAIAAARVATLPVISPAASQIVASIVITAGVVTSSAVLLRPARRRADPWAQVLASPFPAIAIVSWVYAGARVTDAPLPPSVLAWLVTGVVLCAFKTGAFTALSQTRMRALQAEAWDTRRAKASVEARYREVSTYSTGMQQRVRLAQALVHDPDLLFLDEPTNGLDPPARERMIRLIKEIRDTNEVHVILSSHLLGDVEE